jgi:hypothetical protein
VRLFDEMPGVNPGEWVANAKGILKTAREAGSVARSLVGVS